MKLTGALKEKVEKMTTKDEVKKAIMEAGMELTEEELEKVDGGIRGGSPYYSCPNCGKVHYNNTRTEKDGYAHCNKCGVKLGPPKYGEPSGVPLA